MTEVSVEQSLTSVSLTAGEGEYAVDFHRTESGWERVEEILDEHNQLVGVTERAPCPDIRRAISDWITQYGAPEITCQPVDADQFFRWLAPCIDERVDFLVVNGQEFDVLD